MLKQDPASDTYEDVEMLIYKVVHKFISRYGGDFEEYLAEANLTYQRVYRTFDPARGELTTVLWTSIWRRLSNLSQKEYTRRGYCPTSLDSETTHGRLGDLVPDTRPERPMFEFLEDLTEDARMVVGLVFSPTKEIEEVAEAKGGTDCNWRSTIRSYLHELGWAAARVAESFEEIRKALP